MRFLSGLFKLLVALFFSLLVLVLAQDLIFFPGVMRSWTLMSRPDPLPPGGVESYMVETQDGNEVEVWRKAGDGSNSAVVMLFHGNGDDLFSFYPVQKWFSDLGMSTYSFDYRGYGRSSGWPSEQGLYQDAHSVWKFIQSRENLEGRQVIFVGYSLGAAVASELATHAHPQTLVLLAPFSSISSLLAGHPLFGYMLPLVWYEFPVISFVNAFKQTCAVLVFSERDTVVPASESERVLEALKKQGSVRTIQLGSAHHGQIFSAAKNGLQKEIESCQTSSEK